MWENASAQHSHMLDSQQIVKILHEEQEKT